MTGTKEKKFYGITHLAPSRLAPRQELDDNRISDSITSYGGGGGNGMDNLERRVTALEEDVKVIRNDLTTLMVRSESFATKADISDIRAEIAALSGSIRTETAEQGGALRAEMASLRGELKTSIIESQQVILDKIDIKFEKLADKTRWKWSAVFIPLAVGVAGVLATLLASYLTN